VLVVISLVVLPVCNGICVQVLCWW
jgi:hypothetical protein